MTARPLAVTRSYSVWSTTCQRTGKYALLSSISKVGVSKGLVTNYGEGGGHVKFYPYEKGGRKKF